MSELIKDIFAPQLEFEGTDNSLKFNKLFCDLYRIELFKDGLDLILTKVLERDLKFEVRIIKGWDTNVGCYLTEQEKVFNKLLGSFSTKIKKKIILRNLACNVMAHEMAHALEFESAISLGEEFRVAIGLDMKNRWPQSVTLKAQIQRLMVDALKTYKPQQFLSELFARYFELLSISRDVVLTGEFTTAEVMDHFVNTTKFIREIFNPAIRSKIDWNISEETNQMIESIKLSELQQKFQEKIESFHKYGGSGGWAKNVRSNASYQLGWKKFEAIEGANNKTLPK